MPNTDVKRHVCDEAHTYIHTWGEGILVTLGGGYFLIVLVGGGHLVYTTGFAESHSYQHCC